MTNQGYWVAGVVDAADQQLFNDIAFCLGHQGRDGRTFDIPLTEVGGDDVVAYATNTSASAGFVAVLTHPVTQGATVDATDWQGLVQRDREEVRQRLLWYRDHQPPRFGIIPKTNPPNMGDVANNMNALLAAHGLQKFEASLDG